MTDYRVTWETDIWNAENPEDAARMARAMQTRPGTIATVFDVFEEGKEPVRVDLTELDEGEPVDDVSAAMGFMTTSKKDDAPAPPITIFNDRELNTILHALRKMVDPTNCTYACDHFDECEPLNEEEIDALCERLQLAPEPYPHAIVTISGGVGNVSELTGPISVEILDYDNLNESLRMGEKITLSAPELAFIRKYDDPDFIKEVEAALEPDETK